MKTLITSTLLLCALSAYSAKPGKNADRGDRQSMKLLVEALKPIDKNGNKTLDREEFGAVRKAFADAPGGPLSALDKNKDKTIEDSEMSFPTRGGAKSESSAERLRELDADHNGKIDGAEIDALKAKISASPGHSLERLDRNKNGKLDDEDIAALNKVLSKSKDAKATKPEAPKAKKDGEEIRKAEVVNATK